MRYEKHCSVLVQQCLKYRPDTCREIYEYNIISDNLRNNINAAVRTAFTLVRSYHTHVTVIESGIYLT